ncbi:MAG: hypothetical protein AB7K24_32320 [Gemmataceae bacterium]
MKKLVPLALLVAGLWLVSVADSQGQFPKRRPGQRPGGNQPGTVKVDVEVTPADSVAVRVMELKPEFDQKGRLKQYTPAEALKLKGDTPAEQKLVGYKTAYTELKRGDVVQVSLATPKKDKTLTPSGQFAGTVMAVAPNMLTVQVVLPAAQAQGKNKITFPADQRVAAMIVIQQRGADQPGGDRPRRNKQ